MKQIYTKTGDQGMTSLRGGVRVPKSDPRIEANGQIDQLNACLGIVRTMLQADDQCRELLRSIQQELMVVMSHIATPDGESNPRVLHCAGLTETMERAIDLLPHEGGFVVPGDGSSLSAFIHLARTQTRTAERCLWSLHEIYPLNDEILVMFNRLSDFLFVLATTNQ